MAGIVPGQGAIHPRKRSGASKLFSHTTMFCSENYEKGKPSWLERYEVLRN